MTQIHMHRVIIFAFQGFVQKNCCHKIWLPQSSAHKADCFESFWDKSEKKSIFRFHREIFPDWKALEPSDTRFASIV